MKGKYGILQMRSVILLGSNMAVASDLFCLNVGGLSFGDWRGSGDERQGRTTEDNG